MNDVVLRTIEEKMMDALMERRVMLNHCIPDKPLLSVAECVISLTPNIFSQLGDEEAVREFLTSRFDADRLESDEPLFYKVVFMKREKKIRVIVCFSAFM